MKEKKKRKKKKKKNKSGNVLAGQAGMKVVGWQRIVWAGTERYAAGGCCRLMPEWSALDTAAFF